MSVLAEKRGVSAPKNASFFALFHVLVLFSVWKLLSASVFRKIRASKKNRAKKPTVGFCVSGSCAIAVGLVQGLADAVAVPYGHGRSD